MISKEKKAGNHRKNMQVTEGDTGSPEVQVAVSYSKNSGTYRASAEQP